MFELVCKKIPPNLYKGFLFSKTSEKIMLVLFPKKYASNTVPKMKKRDSLVKEEIRNIRKIRRGIYKENSPLCSGN
jgi:hypothetical protein